jgi:hypothetical protein
MINRFEMVKLQVIHLDSLHFITNSVKEIIILLTGLIRSFLDLKSNLF